MANPHEMQALIGFRPSAKAPAAHLTERQLEVLVLLCEGLQNKQIARRLNIAGATVKIHVANILRTLNVSNRLQAALVATSHGLQEISDYAQSKGLTTGSAARDPVKLRLVTENIGSSYVPADPSDWSLEAAAG
jgi:DNA-binding CsgD family transcriptional regulator